MMSPLVIYHGCNVKIKQNIYLFASKLLLVIEPHIYIYICCINIFRICLISICHYILCPVSDKYIIYLVDTIMINHYPLVNEHPESHQSLETEL